MLAGRTQRRVGWTLLGSGVGLFALLGSAVALHKLDREQFRGEPEELRKLQAAPLRDGAARPAAPGEWPQWRGPNRDGLSPETGLRTDWPREGPRVLWEQPSGRGFSCPVVARR